MHTKTTFRRLAAAAALLGYLGWSTAQPAAATDTISQYGYWASVVDTADNGTRVCGVRTHMQTGGELRLMVLDGGVHLIAYDPNWLMRTGSSSHVTVAVDDQIFSGRGRAIDGQTLLVMSLSEDFLQQFIDGSEMVADFGGVRWTVSLNGSSRATGDMGTCLAAAHRGVMS